MLISAIARLVIAIAIMVRCFGIEQLSDQGDIGGTIAIAKKSVMADAVLTFWQNVDQEPADELTGLQGHGGVSAGTIDAVILDAEGDATLIHPDQAAIGNRDPMGIA